MQQVSQSKGEEVMRVGDRVEVIFSDGHIQEGQIKSIDEKVITSIVSQ